MPREAKRRFLGLKVGEVSLVDSPANEVEFLVTKNLEEDPMSVKTNEAGSTERVSIEQTEEGDNVAKALEHVSAIVEKVAALVTKKASTEETAPSDEDEEDVEKASLNAALKKAGVTLTAEQSESLKAAGFDPNAKFQNKQDPLQKGKKAMPPGAEPDEDDMPPKGKKSAKTAKASETEEESEDALDTLARVAKAGKVFTKARVAKLQEAIDTLKLLMESIGVGQAPNANTPQLNKGPSIASGIKDLQSGDVMKAADEGDLSAVIKGLEGVTKALESLGTSHKTEIEGLKAEINTLKSARPASESLEGAGGTDTKKSGGGSLWTNVL